MRPQLFQGSRCILQQERGKVECGYTTTECSYLRKQGAEPAAGAEDNDFGDLFGRCHDAATNDAWLIDTPLPIRAALPQFQYQVFGTTDAPYRSQMLTFPRVLMNAFPFYRPVLIW
eukprot:3836769-Rhodomonas_salina.3